MSDVQGAARRSTLGDSDAQSLLQAEVGGSDTALEKFDAFLNDVGLSVDDFFDILARAWIEDADAIDATESDGHATAKAVLQSAADHLQQAGMDWYVSTK